MITLLPPHGHPHPSLIPILVLEGRWEGGHDLCPSFLEEWVSLAMVTPSLFYKEGRKVCMTSDLPF